jgi:uncharacterized protein (DUF488 family)
MQQRLSCPKSFFTLGYAGRSVTSMAVLLRSHGVELLIDVRRNPVSRKPGFSKKRLEAYLAAAGIGYVHCPGLGMPVRIRKRYGTQSDTSVALRAYRRYLESRKHYVLTLLRTFSSKRFCLLCLEKDPKACHRSIIAEMLAEVANCPPTHLT